MDTHTCTHACTHICTHTHTHTHTRTHTHTHTHTGQLYTYLSTHSSLVADKVHCLPCDKSCRTCSGPSPKECLTCRESYHLSDGACTQSWITRVQGSMQGLVLGLVLLCSLLLIVFGRSPLSTCFCFILQLYDPIRISPLGNSGSFLPGESHLQQLLYQTYDAYFFFF